MAGRANHGHMNGLTVPLSVHPPESTPSKRNRFGDTYCVSLSMRIHSSTDFPVAFYTSFSEREIYGVSDIFFLKCAVLSIAEQAFLFLCWVQRQTLIIVFSTVADFSKIIRRRCLIL